jgi:hypothetical protein
MTFKEIVGALFGVMKLENEEADPSQYQNMETMKRSNSQ